MSYKIYKYTNTINNKVYIGQTKLTLSDRAQSNGRNYRECRKFYNAIQKYGWDKFEGEILADGLTFDEANSLECFYIRLYRATEDAYGYNIESGGHYSSANDETKRIISQKAKLRYRDQTKNPMYGKSHSDESKRLMSEIKRGNLNPMFGKHWSDKQRLMCNNTGKHLKLSDERLREMSKWATELGHRNAKKIRCIEDDILFESLTAAAEYYSVNIATLCGQLKGKQKTCRGRHFEYI